MMGIDTRIRHMVGKGARIALVFLFAFWSCFQAEIAIAYGSQGAPDYAGNIADYTPEAFQNLTVLVPNIEQDDEIQNDEFLASGVSEDEAAMKMYAEPGGTLQLGAMLEWIGADGSLVSADAQGLVVWGVDGSLEDPPRATIDDRGLLTLGDSAVAGDVLKVTCALKDLPIAEEGEISAGGSPEAGNGQVAGIVEVSIALVERPAEPVEPPEPVGDQYVSGLVIVDSDGNYYETKSVAATVAEGDSYTLDLGALVNVFDEATDTNHQLHCVPGTGLARASAEVLDEPLSDLTWAIYDGEAGGATIEDGVLTVTTPSERAYRVTCSSFQGMNGAEVWDELYVTVSAELPPDEPPAAEADQGADNPQSEISIDIVNSTGGPVGETVTFTVDEINEMGTSPQLFTVLGDSGDGNGEAYHTINGNGPALSTVLDRALGSCMEPHVDVALTTADIATVEFSNGSFSTEPMGYNDFINRDRYYFPNIYSGGEGDASFAGAVPVAPMLATTAYVNPYGVAGPTEEAYVSNTCFRLLLGSVKPAGTAASEGDESTGEEPAGDESQADEGASESGESGESGDAPVVPNVGDDTKPFQTVSLNHITIKLKEGAGDSQGGDDHGSATDGELRAMVTGQFAKKGQRATLSLNVGGTADASFTIMWKESADGGQTWEDYIDSDIGEQTIHIDTDDVHIGRLYRADVHVMFPDGTTQDISSNEITMHEADDSLSVGLGYEAVYTGDTAIFSATLNGASQGDVEYIWEESSDGGLTWETVSGASGPTYATITDEDHLGNWYRVRVKDKDGNEATSNIQQMMALTDDVVPIDDDGNFIEDEDYNPELDDLGYDYDDYYDYEDYSYEPTVTEVDSIEMVEPEEFEPTEPVEGEEPQEEELTDNSLKLLVDPAVSEAIKEQEQKKLDSTPGAKWSEITKVDAPTVKEILSDNPFVPLSVPFCVGACAAGVVEKTVEYRNQKRKPGKEE